MENMMIVVQSGPDDVTRVMGGLRLAAALLGMDYTPVVVFVDDGIECLRPGVIGDPVLGDYMKVVADIAGIYVLSESLEARGMSVDDLDPGLDVTPVDLAWLADAVAEIGTTAAL